MTSIRTRPATNDEQFDAWHASLLNAAKNYRRSAKALARELHRGMRDFGEARFWAVADETGLSEHTINNYLSLARAYEPDGWRETVPLGIHEAVVSFKPNQREAIFDCVQKLGWDRAEVRRRVQAYKAGDETAFDPRRKVAAPEPKPKEKAPEPADHSRMRDEQSAVHLVPAAIVAPAPAFENVPDTTATQKLETVVSLMKAIREDPEFLEKLDVEPFAPAAVQLEGQYLVNIAAHIKQRQSLKFDRKSKPKAQ